MTDPAPTGEPKTFSEDYVQQLRTEAGGYRTSLRKAEQERDAAIAERDQARSELTTAQASSGDADSRVAAAEGTALRYEVALDKGLPPALARRLAGASREELEADADELLKLAGRTPPEPNPGQAEGQEPNTSALSPIQAALQKARGGRTSS